MRPRTLARVVVALLVIVGALAAPSAEGQSRSLVLTGRLTWVWRADPARGCAAMGLCGVNGSIEVDATAASQGEGGRSVSIGLRDPGAVARVQEPSGRCTDLVPVSVSLSSTPGGRRVSFAANGDGEPPSSGRCAGPTPEDLARSQLPVRRAGPGYDLAATTSFGAGPFEVTLLSTLAVRPGSPSSPFGAADRGASAAGPSTAGPPAPRTVPALHRRPPSPRFEYAEVVYRVSSVSGALGVRFRGLPSPLCEAVDACGTAGTISERVAGASGTLAIGGQQTIRRGLAPTQALADLRAGRLATQSAFDGRLPAVLTETLARAGGPACTEARPRPDLALTAGNPSPQMLVLNSPGMGPRESLRSRCPGPSRADILGGGPLAAGSLSLRSIGGRTLRIVLRNPGGFQGLSYAGGRHGALVLRLRRTLVRAGTSANPPNLPGLP